MGEGLSGRKRTRHNSGRKSQNGKQSPKLMPGREDGENFLQTLANLTHVCVRACHERQRHLLFVAFALIAKVLARTRDGVTLFIQQLLDAHDALDVAAPVHALARAAFDGLELRELGFPEAQNVRGKAAQARDFADPEVKFFWDKDVSGLSGFSVGLFFRTHAACFSVPWGLAGRPEFPDTAVSSRMRSCEQPHFRAIGSRRLVVGR
jgi:hypothetical protein